MRHGGLAALGSALGAGVLVVGAFFIGEAQDAGVLWLVPIVFYLVLALIVIAGAGAVAHGGRRR